VSNKKCLKLVIDERSSIMKVRVLFVSLLLSVVFAGGIAFSDTGRAVMNLNGRWEFEQTETAFPPERFTRSIPVPGLIDSAEPKIEQYQKYFSGTHQPRYNCCLLYTSPSPRD